MDRNTAVYPTEERDLPQVAELLVQLYHEEAPGMLPGWRQAECNLLSSLLYASKKIILKTSYVIKESERVVAYAAFAPASLPRHSSFTVNLVIRSCSELGFENGIRYLMEYIKLTHVVCAPLSYGTGQLHSLVVDRSSRGKGYGRALCNHIELVARRQHDTLLIYVLYGNAVTDFYSRLGYELVKLPQQRSLLKRWYRYRSIAMSKSLLRQETTSLLCH